MIIGRLWVVIPCEADKGIFHRPGVEDVSEDSVGQDSETTSESGIPVRIVGYDAVEPGYANDVYVGTDGSILNLTFMRFLPQPIYSPADAQPIVEQGFQAAQVIGRVVVPPLIAERLIRLLQEGLDRQREIAPQMAAFIAGQQPGQEEERGD